MDIDSNMDSNQELMSPEQLRQNLLGLNNNFCKYLQSLNQDFDKSPEQLDNSIKNSNNIIDEFTNFYNNFKLIKEKALNSEINPNKNQSNSPPKEIKISNTIVKGFKFTLKNSLDKLKTKNDEYSKLLINYENEYKKRFESPKIEKNNQINFK